MEDKKAIGIDIGGTNIKFGIVDKKGKIIKKTSLKTNADEGPDEVISQIKNGISKLLDDNKKNIKGIGFGAPGVVSNENGTVENPPNLPGWEKIKLGAIIKDEFGIKTFVENDANAAAVGEMIFGAGKKIDSFIMVTLGTGVGGGIIFNKELFRGDFGAAGELGHITINYKGPKCKCGSYGCIETYAGNHYISDRVKKQLKKNKDSEIWNLIDNDLSKVNPKIIQKAAEKGDELAMDAVDDLGFYLGAAFASVANLLDISTFIIGGGVAGFGKPLFDSIKESTKNRVLTSLKKRVKILNAKLKNDAGVKGASALVFHKT